MSSPHLCCHTVPGNTGCPAYNILSRSSSLVIRLIPITFLPSVLPSTLISACISVILSNICKYSQFLRLRLPLLPKCCNVRLLPLPWIYTFPPIFYCLTSITINTCVYYVLSLAYVVFKDSHLVIFRFVVHVRRS